MARKSERLHTMLGMYQCNSWLILVITESTAIIRNHMAKTGGFVSKIHNQSHRAINGYEWKLSASLTAIDRPGRWEL